MPTRNFGPRHDAIDEALRRLSRISRAEADRIVRAYDTQLFEARAIARVKCQIASGLTHRQAAWAAARAFAGDSASHAAYYADGIHYSKITRGSDPDATTWRTLREAYRDAAVGAVVADIAEPALVDTLVAPVIGVLPNLHHTLTGR